MKPGTRVICVKDHPFTPFENRSGLETVAARYPKAGEEFVVEGNDGRGFISLYELNYGNNIFYWEQHYFAPVAPLEEEIASLMEVEEPQTA